MGDRTGIEWCDATWNPIRGCSRVSEGCRHCYAEQIAARFCGPGLPYDDLARRVGGEARWTNKVSFVEQNLDLPLRWRKPRRIFVNSMSDLFHEEVPDEWIDKIFAVMALAPQHTFITLTKRPERMRNYIHQMRGLGRNIGGMAQQAWLEHETTTTFGVTTRFPIRAAAARERALYQLEQGLPNVWPGVSVEDQPTAEHRIPLLLATPAAKRLISVEPLLGPVDLSRLPSPDRPEDEDWRFDALAGDDIHYQRFINDFGEEWWDAGDGPLMPRLDWVICGSESGREARSCDLAWVRSLRDQCSSAGVPFFWKQHLENGRKLSTPTLDGRTWDEVPV